MSGLTIAPRLHGGPVVLRFVRATPCSSNNGRRNKDSINGPCLLYSTLNTVLAERIKKVPLKFLASISSGTVPVDQSAIEDAESGAWSSGGYHGQRSVEPKQSIVHSNRRRKEASTQEQETPAQALQCVDCGRIHLQTLIRCSFKDSQHYIEEGKGKRCRRPHKSAGGVRISSSEAIESAACGSWPVRR